MGTSIINAGALSAVSIFGAQIPSAGPQCVPVLCDFSQFDGFTLDYSNQQSTRGSLQMCQTIFIDASNVDNAVSVQFSGTSQTIKVPGRTQGYYSVTAANPLRVSFNCPAGGAVVQFLLLNYPVANAQWKTQ